MCWTAASKTRRSPTSYRRKARCSGAIPSSIPANSTQKYTAEVFINFLLRPDINARIANENRYATPNEAALPLIDSAIRNDPVVFPPNQAMLNAELVLPLSPAGEKRYADLWARFMDGKP